MEGKKPHQVSLLLTFSIQDLPGDVQITQHLCPFSWTAIVPFFILIRMCLILGWGRSCSIETQFVQRGSLEKHRNRPRRPSACQNHDMKSRCCPLNPWLLNPKSLYTHQIWILRGFRDKRMSSEESCLISSSEEICSATIPLQDDEA